MHNCITARLLHVYTLGSFSTIERKTATRKCSYEDAYTNISYGLMRSSLSSAINYNLVYKYFLDRGVLLAWSITQVRYLLVS